MKPRKIFFLKKSTLYQSSESRGLRLLRTGATLALRVLTSFRFELMREHQPQILVPMFLLRAMSPARRREVVSASLQHTSDVCGAGPRLRAMHPCQEGSLPGGCGAESQRLLPSATGCRLPSGVIWAEHFRQSECKKVFDWELRVCFDPRVF